jgi:gamma-glutamyltranspeptidase/glutathione hydrolase
VRSPGRSARWACSLCLAIASAAPAQEYQHAAIATDHALASEAGVEMLRQGGNAVDAAVAASFCLSVVRPYSCGLGGGGFMLVWLPRGGRAVAIDYRETAPAAAGPDYYARSGDETASRFGGRAVAVPGTVAGLLHALARYGTLGRATVMAPAIRIAGEGFAADADHVRAAAELESMLASRPALRALAQPIRSELCLDGEIAAGEVIRRPQHAAALRLVAEHGAGAFYRGDIGSAIVTAVREHGGAMTLDDLAAYRVVEREPLRGWFRGRCVLAMPPPSSGGLAVLQILGILHRRTGPDDMLRMGPATDAHYLVEAMKSAFADRAAWGCDPAFCDVPVERLLSAAYLDERARGISPDRTVPAAAYAPAAPPPDDGGTSHISVIDAGGNAVACTETINLTWGSLLTVTKYGIILNDEMDDFATRPDRPNAFGLLQSPRNAPQPGKRPLSSMSPTIVLENGHAVLVAGGAGGPRIISATVQCMVNCLVRDMPPQEAVAAPRFHHQWMPDVLEFEQDRCDDARIEDLRGRGHAIGFRDHVGIVQMVQAGPRGLRAGSDPRKGGAAAGY